MPNFALECWPDPDRRVVDFLTAETEAEALARFRERHGCAATRINGRAVAGRSGREDQGERRAER